MKLLLLHLIGRLDRSNIRFVQWVSIVRRILAQEWCQDESLGPTIEDSSSLGSQVQPSGHGYKPDETRS